MNTETATISTLLSLHRELHGSSESPQLDCQLILGHILNKPRAWLLANDEHTVDPGTIKTFMAHLARRREGEPLGYLTGIKEFWSLTLEVSTDTLIPRPETELLVETALERLPADHRTIADLGTGSGAIAIALAVERPAWSIVATDNSEAALAIARKNAARHDCNNITFLLTDWCTGLGDHRFDMIVSNPPYVECGDPHLNGLRHEPASALVSNDNGMADLKRIMLQAPALLKQGGLLILEHGYNQQEAVCAELRGTGYQDIEVLYDLGGQPRCAVATSASPRYRNSCYE
ncbi:MAG: peptide chain release factor N(5)-glutamine methyltransferase [Pseudomonadales bacterium]